MKRFQTAFTLVELLTVVAIIGIITALAVPAFRSLNGAQRLTTGTDLIAGQLDLARQTAMAESARIELRFWNLPDAVGSGSGWRAVQLYRVSGVPIAKAVRIPEGFMMLESDKFSTLLGSANSVLGTGDVFGLAGCKYKAIRFSPEGAADLNPGGPAAGSNSWTVTVVPESAKPTDTRPATNFATVQLDPVTGRVRVYRP